MYCAFIDRMSYNKAERYAVARKGKLMPHGRSARDQEQEFPNSLRSTVPEREFHVLPWTSPVVDICRGIVQINKPSTSVHNLVLLTMYLCIVRLKFTATLIYKRVALYNFQNKVLAVGLENNCHVFEGQRNFETDCRADYCKVLGSPRPSF
ncbi:hypothetical protein BDV38DRAFT_210954 [Aspergillus pseudotamarii]|uniref:Uncharacterized protein n=1 Tax=Aspergillus pseudotamarii TaxID=132259 RepID=A0A5N6SCX1_ASPPS|nr:uncharacterized protein BDV38DRAFT_210954 [Aspergillus pseudotamarii]KAE8132445.1 hypothetical protein BDV38DRAFT_210954 [Aspergillus pseudotamarii]